MEHTLSVYLSVDFSSIHISTSSFCWIKKHGALPPFVVAVYIMYSINDIIKSGRGAKNKIPVNTLLNASRFRSVP